MRTVRRREMLAGALGAVAQAVLSRPAAARPAAARPAAAAEGEADRRLRRALDALAASPDEPAANLRRIEAWSPAGLSPGAALDLAVAREGLAIDARLARDMPFGVLGRSPYSVTMQWGAWREAAAPGAAERIAAETVRVRREGEAGIVLPRPLLDRTIAAIERAAAATSGPAARPLAEQAAELARWRDAAGAAPGVGRLHGGTGYVDLLLDRQFGDRGGAAAAHRRFLAEAAVLTDRIDGLLRRLGYRQGSVAVRLRAAFRDPRHLYPDSEAGRDRAVADMNAVLARAKVAVPALVGTVPPETLDVVAARMSAAEVAAGKGGYRVLPEPGGRPGRYVVDLADIRRRPAWSLGSVVHHELLPGHMVQMPIEKRAAPHPLRLAYAAAYQEGWAILAEELMAGAGAFAGDDLMQLGHLHWLMFRIARAAIDTGVHHHGWSAHEAREKLEGMMGEPAYFASFDQDVDRVCLEPAVRAGEALAWLTLRDLHARAARRPGAGPAFLHAALVDGRMRHTQLERRVG